MTEADAREKWTSVSRLVAVHNRLGMHLWVKGLFGWGNWAVVLLRRTQKGARR